MVLLRDQKILILLGKGSVVKGRDLSLREAKGQVSRFQKSVAPLILNSFSTLATSSQNYFIDRNKSLLIKANMLISTLDKDF